MMENIRKVTDHIRRRVAAAGGDPRREAMTVVATRDGKLYHVDAQGEYWAVSVFISDTIAYNKADSLELARKGGEGIGKVPGPAGGLHRAAGRDDQGASTTSATASCSGTRRCAATPQAA